MRLEYKTLSNRTVEKLKVQKDTVFWKIPGRTD